MKPARQTASQWIWGIVAILAVLIPAAVHAGNQVMGEIQLKGKSKVEKTSGVWVDGQYVGYLKELKGSKRILLLPGEHTISARQNGYQDFIQNVMVRPGEKQVVQVAMMKAPIGTMPKVWSQVKITVNPSRAAVFLDGRYIGHVGEFEGTGRALLVAPGDHKIKIALPGFQSFETEINPSPNQKVEVKTNLLKTQTPVEDPSLKGGDDDSSPPPPQL